MASVHVHFGLSQPQCPSSSFSVQLFSVPWMSVFAETPKDKEGHLSLTTTILVPEKVKDTGTLCSGAPPVISQNSSRSTHSSPKNSPICKEACVGDSSPNSPSQPANTQLHLKFPSYSLPWGVLTLPSVFCPMFRIIFPSLISPHLPLKTVCIPLLMAV